MPKPNTVTYVDKDKVSSFHLISIHSELEGDEIVIHLAGIDNLLELRLDEDKLKKMLAITVDGISAVREVKKRRNKVQKATEIMHNKLLDST